MQDWVLTPLWAAIIETDIGLIILLASTLLGISFKARVKKHPILVIFIFFLISSATYFIRLGTSDRCKVLSADNREFFHANGDRVGFDGWQIRPCQHQQISAFEFFLWSKQVSAGAFVNEQAEVNGKNDWWHELTFFQDENHFAWKQTDYRDDAWFDDTCTPWTPQNGEEHKKFRHGFLIESIDLRTFPRDKTPEQFRRCNELDSGDPANDACEFSKLQFFIPAFSPNNLCRQTQSIWAWFERQTYARPILNEGIIGDLRLSAQNRKNISAEQFDEYVKGAPKICMRFVDDKHRLTKSQQSWGVFGSIAQVWCDQ